MVHRELVPTSSARDLALWLLRRRRRFRVTGMSMAPLLKPGDDVLVDPGAYRGRLPRRDEIVVVRHPFRSDIRLIKRVTEVAEDGRCRLQGDNPSESTDSRTFGWVMPDRVIGRVTSRMP